MSNRWDETQEKLKSLVKTRLVSLGASPDEVENIKIEFNVPPKDVGSDISTNAALPAAKPLRKNPREIAEKIKEILADVNEIDPESIKLEGPGFINANWSDALLLKVLEDILSERDKYGFSDKHKGEKVQIEFVSANPTGPLHIGHARGAIVGDTLANLFSATGYEVSKEYYYNDAGVQMDTLGYSTRARYLELLGLPNVFPENGYKGEYIVDIARKIVDEKGDSLAETDDPKPFTDVAAEALMAEINKDLHALGIDFDSYFSETSLHKSGEVAKTVENLKKAGAVYEEDGAWWLDSTRWGDEKNRVVVKSDGNYTYLTPDIAYHRTKFDRGYDLIITLLGGDHHGYLPRLKAAMAALDYQVEKLKYILLQMVTLKRGGENIKLSTRSGDFLDLSSMINEIGSDVTRYFFLQRSPEAQMVFDYELAKTNSLENPVYYLQYVHARICSIERKAKDVGIDPPYDMPLEIDKVVTPESRSLIVQCFQFPKIVDESAEKLQPQILTTFLESLAKSFHSFYHIQMIVVSDDPQGSAQRLQLARGIGTVIRNGLGLLEYLLLRRCKERKKIEARNQKFETISNV